MENHITAYEQLNNRQKLFVDKYVTSLNGAQSAREAGYSANSANRIASENLSKPLIKQAIEDRLAVRSHNEEVTPTYIRKGIKDTIEECKVPKDKFIGYELLAKVTPGTLDQPKQGDTYNLFALLGDMLKVKPPAPPVDVTAVGIDKPAGVDIASTIYIEKTTQESKTESTLINSHPPVEPVHPPDPPVDNNKNPQKISQQKSDIVTPESSAPAEETS